MNKKIAILSLIFLLPLFMWAHGDKISISFSGIISEPAGAAVEGAVISIEYKGQIIHSTSSDAQGNFDIKMEGPIGRYDQLKVRVSKKGYRSSHLIPVDCQNKNIELTLQRAPVMIPIMRTLEGNSLAI
ncbi:carboxypeptidase-like regulatory domain-containing protein [Owenweeksia hongkongensis]|nr:carboxypeptidase-like regulatory domain-containing protein [Owenweeksia hongkongensis]